MPIITPSTPPPITATVTETHYNFIIIGILLASMLIVITVTMVTIGLLCRKLRTLKSELSLYSENSVMLAVISAHEL